MHHVAIFEPMQLFFAGVLAGFEIAVHYGLVPPSGAPGEAAQLMLRQALIRRLRVLAPALFLPCLLLTIAVITRQWHAPRIWLQGVGLAGLVLWIVIRIVRTVPVNSATMEWDPAFPPANWRALVEATERFHVVAAWAAVCAFLCFLVFAFSA